MISIQCISALNCGILVENLPLETRPKFQFSSYIPCFGFTFVSSHLVETFSDRSHFLVAYKAKKVVGMLKLTRSLKYSGFSITWIDVHRDHRKQGIMKALLQELNNIILPGLPIVVTDPTEDGFAANILENTQKIVSNGVVYSSLEELPPSNIPLHPFHS